MRAIQVGKTALIALMLGGTVATPGAQQDPVVATPPVATFKAGVDLVRISAVVRDKRGRFVQDLKATDFEVIDADQTRTISDFRRDAGAVSVAIVFDVSGSMEARLGHAREAAISLLSGLDDQNDEAAIYTFDTRLVELKPFTTGLRTLPDSLSTMTPFGATSLHDAIARTAERVGARAGLRRAVVVFTDGQDTASRLTPGEVSGIASAIDVPVYIVGIVPSIDNPSSEQSGTAAEHSALAGPLNDLATWTGGSAFVVSTTVQRSTTAHHIIDELRHQYLIAFESGVRPGWHPLLVRARDRDLTVRARGGYIAGQSRPISN